MTDFETKLKQVLAEAPPLRPEQIAHIRAVLAQYQPKENKE